MKRRVVSGIMLTLFLIIVSAMVIEVPSTMAYAGGAELPSDCLTILEDDGGNPSSLTHFQDGFSYDVSKDSDVDRSALGEENPNSYIVYGGKWDFNNTEEWSDFAKSDDDSAELVIGVNNEKPNSYEEMVRLVAENGGDLVGTVLMGDEIKAVVGDIPLPVISHFVTEVQATGLSRYIEPNMKFQTCIVPNDSYWSCQWGPRTIEADYAWNTTVGDPSVLVAVIDTGIDYDHPDLAANYVPSGYDWVNNDTDPMDDYGHGTHCAGIIAAVTNNSIGIAGLAQVNIMAEKVLGAGGSGDWDDIANGIIHAVDGGADILSLSLGGSSYSTTVHEAIKYAYVRGVLVVAAAGNEATSTKHYPAAYDEVIAVTATDEYDDPAWFGWWGTNFGEWVELAAPGVDIYSTVWDDSYTNKSGTSMATPHVAGVAALILSQFPNMTRDQLRLQLRYTADDLGLSGFDEYYGYGRINARRAVEQAPPDHDLVVLDLKIPVAVRPGNTMTANATVTNFGLRNESNIALQLLVNGSVANSTSISFLSSGTSVTVSLKLTPMVDGTYNVTSYVVPVPGETTTWNNALSGYVQVRGPKVFRVPEDYSTIQAAINAAVSGWGDIIRVSSGTYHENVVVNKTVSLVGENTSTTIIEPEETWRDVVYITSDNVSFSGFWVRNGEWTGIEVNARDSVIARNNVSNNRHGIRLISSSNNTLKNNDASNNTYNFGVYGWSLSHYIQDIDDSNTVDGKPIYYWISKRDMTVPPNFGYLALVNCTRITVQNLNLTNNGQGVLMAYTTNSTITKNNITNNGYGIYLYESSNNSISGNNVKNNWYSIWLFDNSYNSISENDITDNYCGILFDYCSTNSISGNHITNNGDGIVLQKSNGSTITGNRLADNNVFGIVLEWSFGNIIYHNNLIKNLNQLLMHASTNIWDNGCEGNYWSDYVMYGEDLDGDGIGDTFLPHQGVDNYPLMSPYMESDVNHDAIVDIVDLVIVGVAFGAEPSDPKWNPHADLNGDNLIDIVDIVMVAIHLWETW